MMEHLDVEQGAGSALPSEVPWDCCPWPLSPCSVLTGSGGTVQPSDATGEQYINNKHKT